MIDKNIFRAYDIRGIFGKTLTTDIMQSIGSELRKMFPKDSFLVGNDVRKSSKELAGALIKGLDKNTVYAGTTAFGETLFAGLKLKKDKTLYITASHSPPEWNGVKLYYGDGEALPSKVIYKIRDNILSDFKESKIDYIDFLKQVKRIDFNDKYTQFMKENFKINKSLRVVVDCGNGSTCLSAPRIFKELGFETIIINGDIDPNFKSRTANIKPKLLEELKKKVISEKADLGVAFDGDGDRFILVDEKGKFHNSSKIGTLLSKYMIKKSSKKKIITTLPVSMAIETELEPLGGKILRVPVGHTYIINKAKSENALMGLEESGHLVITDYFYFDDGIIAPLKTAEIMSENNKKLSELTNEIPEYPFDELVFDCSDETKFDFINKMQEKLSKKYEKVSDIDGLRIQFEKGWILLRASNTGPKIRLYIEAKTEEKFEELKEKFTKLFSEELKKC